MGGHESKKVPFLRPKAERPPRIAPQKKHSFRGTPVGPAQRQAVQDRRFPRHGTMVHHILHSAHKSPEIPPEAFRLTSSMNADETAKIPLIPRSMRCRHSQFSLCFRVASFCPSRENSGAKCQNAKDFMMKTPAFRRIHSKANFFRFAVSVPPGWGRFISNRHAPVPFGPWIQGKGTPADPDST